MDSVFVIDFGGQYSHLIARRVRELRVYSELVPYDTEIDKIRQMKPRGLIFSGSPYSIPNSINMGAFCIPVTAAVLPRE